MGAAHSKKWKFRISYNNNGKSNSTSSGSNNVNCVRDYQADEGEIDQMNIQHHLIREVWNGNFSSPIKEKLRNEQLKVLQVRYTGVDNLELITETRPSNVEFIKCNFLQGLPFEDNTFDFVLMRFKILEFTEHQWESFVVKEEFMRNTNLLINIESFVKRVPCGSWAGKVGEAGAIVLRDGFLKHMGFILSQQNSSSSSIINEILSCNDSNPVFNNNRQQRKGSIIGGRSGIVKNNIKSNNNDDDDSRLKTVLENYLNEANLYKTTFDTFRFIGQKKVT
ncbi:8045_t:CDS:2 [Entrophospora sp. SA101]|nr:8045_t:CDS:2 [Entrophospora sp. SA101]